MADVTPNATREQFLPDIKINEYINAAMQAKALGEAMAPVALTTLLPGAGNDSLRQSIITDGVGRVVNREGQETWLGMDVDEDGQVMAVAATIPRAPSKAQDFLREVSDFREGSTDRKQQIGLYRRIYGAEGLVNNAISKVAALIATKVRFEVRRVKGVRGKGGDKRAEEFLALLNYWLENVNSPSEDGVVTGGRGIQAFLSQGVRTALIEGDHFARMNWKKENVPTLNNKPYSLPMNLQTFGGDVIEIPESAAALGIDFIYWVPPRKLVDSLTTEKDKELLKEMKKLIPTEVLSKLKKDGKYRLDPKLMAHIRHRGQMNQPYGESFIQCAMSSIAYKRALQALDIVTIENLLNRLLVIKVGSDDSKSVYHKQEVTARRVTMLQNMMKKVGPSSTLIWAGPDLSIEEAGAHGKILEMDGRYALANSMIRGDLGTPSALLTGEGADGKASALAAIIAVAAQIIETQSEYGQFLRTSAQRIGIENGFEDVDVAVHFAPNPLINREQTTAQLLSGFQAGAVPTQVLIEDGYGGDYEAWEAMMAYDVAKGYREKMFGPPLALITTNPAGTDGGGGGAGRPTRDTTGKPDPRENRETESTEENK